MILIFITLFSGIFYVTFLVRVYSGLLKLKTPERKNDAFPDITVIIPFRNEHANLKRSLQSLEAQTYPKSKMKVLYIDDHSSDNGVDILKEYKGALNFEVITNKEEGKKQAIEIAVREADSEIIVITDADCTHSPEWLEYLVQHFDERTGFVAGPVKFSKGKSLFDNLQELEFNGIIVASAGLIASGTPFTCSAANIAFRKQAFLEVNGYRDNLHIPSGDDEFLMQKIAYESAWEVKYTVGDKVMVETKANRGVNEFVNQRSRWASKGFNYRERLITLQLLLIFVFFISIFINFAAAFVSSEFLITALIAFAIKFIAEYSIMLQGKKIIFKEMPLKYIWLAELLHIPYILAVSLTGTLGAYKWKGRTKK